MIQAYYLYLYIQSLHHLDNEIESILYQHLQWNKWLAEKNKENKKSHHITPIHRNWV